MTITNDIKYVGVNDHVIDLFEGQYDVPNGMAYNSYVILDEKTAVMDTVDRKFTHEWLDNVAGALEGRKPDYLIVQHMEPDHSANITQFMNNYPDAVIISSAKAFIWPRDFCLSLKYLDEAPPTKMVITYITIMVQITTPVSGRLMRSIATNSVTTVSSELNTCGMLLLISSRILSISLV